MSYRNVLQSVSQLVSNYSYYRKKRLGQFQFPTVRFLCESVNIQLDTLEPSVVKLLDCSVSYVCRYGDRFTRGCICVQLYDDSDDIMKKAISKGALVCITDHLISGLPCIVVSDPHETYTKLCCFYRKFFESKGTAVFGSIGKTTTKKMIYEVYKQGVNTWCDTGNDNIHDSIGSICQHIPENVSQVIFELSEDTPGLIQQMAKIIAPDICVVTDIDKSHIKFYGSEENIIHEFETAISCLNGDGVCITNYDNANNRSLSTDKRIIYVSMKSTTSDYYADSIKVYSRGLQFIIHEKATKSSYNIRLHNTYALHNVYSAMLAFAAGVQIGLSYEKIIRGLSKYRPSGFRQNIYRSGKTVIYADCFNAVSKSIRSAIHAADKIPIKGKRIAVLGDIAEAGNYTEETHSEIVKIVNDSTFNVLMTCGEELKKALESENLRKDLEILTFDTQKEMNKAIKKISHKGDLVLFKSSHSGNLQYSIRSAFPVAYYYQMFKYYIPRLRWHFSVLWN